jgi:hypothetical protein
MAMAQTRLSHRAQVQCSEAVEPLGSATPGYRGVGMAAARTWLCGAKQPP